MGRWWLRGRVWTQPAHLRAHLSYSPREGAPVFSASLLGESGQRPACLDQRGLTMHPRPGAGAAPAAGVLPGGGLPAPGAAVREPAGAAGPPGAGAGAGAGPRGPPAQAGDAGPGGTALQGDQRDLAKVTGGQGRADQLWGCFQQGTERAPSPGQKLLLARPPPLASAPQPPACSESPCPHLGPPGLPPSRTDLPRAQLQHVPSPLSLHPQSAAWLHFHTLSHLPPPA